MNLFENLQMMNEINSDKIKSSFNISGFECSVVDKFEDDGVKGYNLVYSKDGIDIVEVEVWEEDSPVTVNDNLYSPNLLSSYYDSFDSFAADLTYKITKHIKESKLENSQQFNENQAIVNYWVYKKMMELNYQVEITDNSLTIRFPKPDNDIYAHYTFRYDEDFEDWLVYFHGDKPERKGELIIDELESLSSYENVVRGCLYHFWNTH